MPIMDWRGPLYVQSWTLLDLARLPFDFQEMCINAVESELKLLSVNKAKGWEAIPPMILRLTAKGIALSLARLSGANE